MDISILPVIYVHNDSKAEYTQVNVKSIRENHYPSKTTYFQNQQILDKLYATKMSFDCS